MSIDLMKKFIGETRVNEKLMLLESYIKAKIQIYFLSVFFKKNKKSREFLQDFIMIF